MYIHTWAEIRITTHHAHFHRGYGSGGSKKIHKPHIIISFFEFNEHNAETTKNRLHQNKSFKKIITCKNSLSTNVSQPTFPLNKH